MLFKKLINMEGDTNGSFIEPLDFEELGELKLSKTDVLIMLDLLDSRTFIPLDYNDEV